MERGFNPEIDQAAYQFDVRLSKPTDWIEMFNKAISVLNP